MWLNRTHKLLLQNANKLLTSSEEQNPILLSVKMLPVTSQCQKSQCRHLVKRQYRKEQSLVKDLWKQRYTFHPQTPKPQAF